MVADVVFIRCIELYVLEIAKPGKAAAFPEKSFDIAFAGGRANRIVIRKPCVGCKKWNGNFYAEKMFGIQHGSVHVLSIKGSRI